MKVVTLPRYFDGYVSLDPGFTDGCGALAGCWDFTEQRLIIQSEFLIFGANTQQIADATERMERDAWGADKYAGGHQQPYKRVSDVDKKLISDLRGSHGLSFVQSEKKGRDAAIAAVRALIEAEQILVSETCKHLIGQLSSGIWNKSRTEFARSERGHSDLLAALVYLVRSIDRRRNPYPEGMPVRVRSQDEAQSIRSRDLSERGLMPETPIGNAIVERDRRRLVNAPWLRRLGWRR